MQFGSRNYGWIPDYPDYRDYSANDLKQILRKTSVPKLYGTAIPNKVDLRQWCSPIEDQLSLGSCCAHAGIGCLEIMERKAYGKHIDASRLFLYKVTRNLLHKTGDSGAFLRSTLGAMVLFGVPPEEYYPYSIVNYDKEPSAFLYSFAQNYKTIKYYKLDTVGISKVELLNSIKVNLASGLPIMFGFTVYRSIQTTGTDGIIPFPVDNDSVVGGHAIAACGYVDSPKLVGGGALLIRNSWGEKWGEGGYGWIPYNYVLRGLAEDFWVIVSAEWIDTGNFKE